MIPEALLPKETVADALEDGNDRSTPWEEDEFFIEASFLVNDGRRNSLTDEK